MRSPAVVSRSPVVLFEIENPNTDVRIQIQACVYWLSGFKSRLFVGCESSNPGFLLAVRIQILDCVTGCKGSNPGFLLAARVQIQAFCWLLGFKSRHFAGC